MDDDNKSFDYSWSILSIDAKTLKMEVQYVPKDTSLSTHTIILSIPVDEQGDALQDDEIQLPINAAAPLIEWTAEKKRQTEGNNLDSLVQKEGSGTIRQQPPVPNADLKDPLILTQAQANKAEGEDL